MYTTDMDTEITGWSCRASNCRSFIVLCSSLLFNFPPFAAAGDGRRRRIDTAAGIDAAVTLKKGPVTVVVRAFVRWNHRAPDKRNRLFGDSLSILNAPAASISSRDYICRLSVT